MDPVGSRPALRAAKEPMIPLQHMRIRISKKLFWSVTAIVTLGLVASILYVSGRETPPEPSRTPFGDLSRAAKGRTDKGFPGHGYTETYERFLQVWRDEAIRIFEIGIESGGSLLMWQEYFPRAKIYGVDINESSRFENARVMTCVADQAKRDQLQKCLDKFGGQFDIIIDDGGHSMEQQQVSLGFLFPYVRPGGFYSLEDIHTSLPSLYPGFGVAPDQGNTTLGMIFKYVYGPVPKFSSQYMLPGEIAYLDAQVETADLHLASNALHSIMCMFKKRGPPAPAEPSATRVDADAPRL